MRCFGNAAVVAGVDAVDELGKGDKQLFKRLCAACWKLGPFPNFVKSARVAAVPGENRSARGSEPPGDPDRHRVRLGELAARDRIDDGLDWGERHRGLRVRGTGAASPIHLDG
jgi:hypothetical protein